VLKGGGVRVVMVFVGGRMLLVNLEVVGEKFRNVVVFGCFTWVKVGIWRFEEARGRESVWGGGK